MSLCFLCYVKYILDRVVFKCTKNVSTGYHHNKKLDVDYTGSL
jgi:hypothetical protein